MTSVSQYPNLDRRRFFLAALGGGTALAIGGLSAIRLFGARGPDNVVSSASAPAAAPADVLLAYFDDKDGHRTGTRHVPKLILTDAQWHQRLPDDSFNVMRREGTERPFSGPHEKPNQNGIYHCMGCATALFKSSTQFDSGTGWPSFTRPIAAENVIEQHDHSFGMDRTAVSCTGCDSHLGHVFTDGPEPTGLRYCMNSVAMRFVAYS